jgi:FHA domain/Domain of unknown function (DUF1707)
LFATQADGDPSVPAVSLDRAGLPQDTAGMAADAPTPVPTRPTDRERERVVRALRSSSLDGSLSADTFERRVARAYAASTRDQLDELVIDVPRAVGAESTIARAAGWLSGATAGARVAWREARVPRLKLPRLRGDLVLGRDPGCDCVLSDETVSRRHARIRRRGDAWLLEDLGSMNGTRVNGWRVTEPVELRPGDRVSFGAARFRVSD